MTTTEGIVGRERDDAIALHTQVPVAAISRSGPVRTAQDLVTYAWKPGGECHAPVVRGRDVLLVREPRTTGRHSVIDS